ncbi:MAG: CopD family protein [Chloroflexota bacterium]|nr:CopD family protein [Chloroflexota bacterium]
MAEALRFWIHLVAATAWVGPQIFMFAAVTPALRTVEEPAARYRAVLVLTKRFAIVAWVAMAVLVVSGILNVMEEQEEFDVFDFDLRYAWLLVTKLSLVALTILLTAWHSYVIGPRLMALLEAGQDGPEAPPQADAPRAQAALRRQSVLVSTINLVVAVAILLLVALLQSEEFSFHRI